MHVPKLLQAGEHDGAVVAQQHLVQRFSSQVELKRTHILVLHVESVGKQLQVDDALVSQHGHACKQQPHTRFMYARSTGSDYSLPNKHANVV